MAGKYGLGSRNERGNRWVQWCAAHSQVITNTCFQEHLRRLWTWGSPGGDVKNQIDSDSEMQLSNRKHLTGEKPLIKKNMEGPLILKSEVRAVVAKMRKNKAAGPDEIMTEMIMALDEFGIEKLTEVINEIYDSGEIPEELSKSIFIALPKKPGTIECVLHRTISLMSHIIKIILKVVMARSRNRIRPEIGKEQCGFVDDAGTKTAIWMVRILSERAIEMQRDLYIRFIDYTKAFDKVQHEELLKLLQSLDLDGKDTRLIRNLYWDQTACMRVENELSEFTQIQRGVRQVSPDLFNLYSEMILRELEGLQGFVVGGHNMNNLRYADDTALISDSAEKLQKLLDKVVEESRKKGLTFKKDGMHGCQQKGSKTAIYLAHRK